MIETDAHADLTADVDLDSLESATERFCKRLDRRLVRAYCRDELAVDLVYPVGQHLDFGLPRFVHHDERPFRVDEDRFPYEISHGERFVLEDVDPETLAERAEEADHIDDGWATRVRATGDDR